MGTEPFDYLHIVLASVHTGLYLITSPSQLTNLVFTSSSLAANIQTRIVPLLVLEGGHIRFR